MDASTLSKLYGLEGPFVTIYLDTTSETEDAASRLETRWKNVLRELTDRDVDQPTQLALTEARGPHGLGNTRVLVASHGTVHLATSLPHPSAQDEMVVGPLPRLIPLVDAFSLQVPHVVVLTDRKGADVFAFTSGPDPVEDATVESTRWPSRKVRTGGWASKRYDTDVEETWEQSARDVADLVDRVVRDVDARVVIASGDERALHLLREHLPKALVDRFVTIGGGGRHADGSEDVIADEIMRVLSDTVARDTLELLEKFAQERGQHDRASDGVAATIEALRKSQVGTLILSNARDSGKTAWFGPEPTHLAERAQELTDLGVPQPLEGPLEEVLLRAALGTAAEVRFVAGDLEQAPGEGVGGLLRYPG